MFSNTIVKTKHEEHPDQQHIEEAIHFLGLLNDRFHSPIQTLLVRRQADLTLGKLTGAIFASQRGRSEWVRFSQWTTAELPPYLQAPERASQMAQAPKGNIRPRSWHMNEDQIQFAGSAICAALFDFGVYAHRMAYENSPSGFARCFDLTDIIDHRDARLWNEIFNFGERTLGVAPGAFKAHVYINSSSAEIELEEIIFELRDRVASVVTLKEQISHELIEICEKCRCLYFLELEQ